MNKKIDGTFKENKTISIHRWYPYVEGFSESFVLECLHGFNKKIIVYDPFNGSGTTSTACSYNGYVCYASEVNPLMRFIANTKGNTVKRIIENKKIDSICKQRIDFEKYVKNKNRKYQNLINNCYMNFNFFSNENLKQINIIKNFIKTIEDKDIRDIFNIALASILVKVSNMTRSTDLRRKTEKELRNTTKYVFKEYISSLDNIINDIIINKNTEIKEFKIISNNAKNIDLKYKNTVDCIITSPPYINGTNYFRNTKLELWILDYIFSDDDSKKYRMEAITAGINNVTKDKKDHTKNKNIINVIRQIEMVSPDKRIPKMVEQYFCDMEIVFKNFSKILRKNGKIFFDIGDSQYYNIYVPVYDFINEIASNYGLSLIGDKILRKRKSKNGMQLSQKLLIYRKD